VAENQLTKRKIHPTYGSLIIIDILVVSIGFYLSGTSVALPLIFTAMMIALTVFYRQKTWLADDGVNFYYKYWIKEKFIPWEEIKSFDAVMSFRSGVWRLHLKTKSGKRIFVQWAYCYRTEEIYSIVKKHKKYISLPHLTKKFLDQNLLTLLGIKNS
jgi:hypothetical protein